MLAEILGSLSGVFSKFKSSETNALFLTAIVWIGWRIWTFTIEPKLRPLDPPVLPYHFPFIGHTISFLWNQEGLLCRASNYFPGDAPFSIAILGTKYIVLRKPENVKAVWNDTKSFSFDDYLRAVFAGFNIPPSSYTAAFKEDPARFWHGDEKLAPYFVKENPAKKRYTDLQDGWMKEALQPGKKMDAVSRIFLRNIEQLIPVYLLDHRVKSGRSEDSGQGQTVDLYKWGRYVLADAGSRAFLGSEILGIDPDFVQHYIDWEDLSWKIPWNYPGFLSHDMYKARETLVQVFMRYYTLEPSQRPNLNWLFDRIRNEHQQLGMSLRDAGTVALIVLWGVHLNTYRMLFWTLAHILASPSLTEAIRDETNSAFDSKRGTLSISHLMNECPILGAVWNEVLRLYASSSMIRSCVSPTTIGNKTVHVGDRLLGQFRPMHLSTSIWGDDALEFNENRWLKDGGIKKPRGFFPFGGGHMHCPGRTLAKQEVFLFVATVLMNYDVQPVGERLKYNGNAGGNGEDEMRWKVPGVSTKHALATLDPAEELFLRIKERYS
ncbi:cytochrome P450 [Cadophora sp. MPI-SDFR-AT-0126]|nr:cytochrome P450 [Leotiomycetes sp. MPI-SDFR-AT-0126]